VEAGIDINAQTDYNGETPLHCCLEFRKTNCLETLLEFRPKLLPKRTTAHPDPLPPIFVPIFRDASKMFTDLIEMSAFFIEKGYPELTVNQGNLHQLMGVCIEVRAFKCLRVLREYG